MNNFISYIAMAQGSDLATTNLFPFPFKFHLIFSILAFVFFVFMFIRERKVYQAILGIAIPFSLCLWISESRTLFQIVGLIELVLIIAALISSIISKKKRSSAQNSIESGDGAE